MERGVVFGTSMLGYNVKDGTLSINPEGAEIVRLIFRKYAVEKKGTTVIVVTHNTEIVEVMKKRVITIQKGVVVSDVKPEVDNED